MTDRAESCPSCGADVHDAEYCAACGAKVDHPRRRGPVQRPAASGSYGPAAWEKLDRSTRTTEDLKLGGRAVYDRLLRPIGRALSGGYEQRHLEERAPDEFDERGEPPAEEVDRRLGLAVVVLAVLVLAIVVLLIAMLT